MKDTEGNLAYLFLKLTVDLCLAQCGCGRGWRRVHRPPLKDYTARLILQFSENRSITFTRSDELARIESLAVGPSTTRRHARQFDIMSMIFFALVAEGRRGIPSLSEYCSAFSSHLRTPTPKHRSLSPLRCRSAASLPFGAAKVRKNCRREARTMRVLNRPFSVVVQSKRHDPCVAQP